MSTILIIDDQPANLKVLVDLLRQKNHTMLVAATGEQGLSIAQKQLPDLILLDVMMPGIDGFQVCTKLKSEEKTSKIPIIFLTALGDIEDKSRAFQAGGVDFIAKPFHEQEALLRVDTHLTLHKQQQELAQKEETLRVTLRSIGDGVITTDTEGNVVFLNTMAGTLTGFNQRESYGKKCNEIFTLIDEKTKEATPCPIETVFRTGQSSRPNKRATLLSKTGVMTNIACNCSPIKDQQDVIIGTVIVFRDISHENMLEAELLKNKKLESIGILAGGIAHDFNNILAAIMGNIDLASHCLHGNPERVKRLLQEAKKASKRAATLTQQLLTFSKGGTPVKETSLLSKIVVESASFVLQGSNTSCSYFFAEDIWPVDVDAGQISQVIQNIIINGAQAMPKGGRITVECCNVTNPSQETLLNENDGHFVKIIIRDNGSGIPSQAIDKIFDPYFSTKQLGNGLGLAICYSIINKHDGYIFAGSAPGEGATFTIYLPANPGKVTALQREYTLEKEVNTSRIMVMDDEKIIRDVVSSQIESLGHTAIAVQDGEEAIATYKSLQGQGTPADMVILDITIAGKMGGKEAARKLLEFDKDAKLIVSSGYSNDILIADYKRFGFQASLTKPFGLEKLKAVIASVLGGKAEG